MPMDANRSEEVAVLQPVDTEQGMHAFVLQPLGTVRKRIKSKSCLKELGTR